MLKVEKRNGNVVDFEQDKIKIAIEKAMKETEKGVDEEVSSKIASEVFEEVKDKDLVNIEDIQDLVELALMKYRP
ncbi:MAG: ATP cone domain-containing protein, partial [Fenollaria timonensis]